MRHFWLFVQFSLLQSKITKNGKIQSKLIFASNCYIFSLFNSSWSCCDGSSGSRLPVPVHVRLWRSFHRFRRPQHRNSVCREPRNSHQILLCSWRNPIWPLQDPHRWVGFLCSTLLLRWRRGRRGLGVLCLGRGRLQLQGLYFQRR